MDWNKLDTMILQSLGIAPQLFWLLLGLFLGWILFKRRTSAQTPPARYMHSSATLPASVDLSGLVGGNATISTTQLKLSDAASEKISRLVREDKIIEAIKTLREETGWGLKESKDVIDAMKRGLVSR